VTRLRQKSFGFDSPPAWAASTLAIFYPPPAVGAGPLAPRIAVTEEPLAPGVSLLTHVNRKLISLSKEYPDLEVLPSQDVTIAGRPAMELRFRFTPHNAPSPTKFEQRLIAVEPIVDGEHRVVPVLLVTGPVDAMESVRPAFEALLNSLSFEPSGVPPASATRPSWLPPAPSPPSPVPAFPMPGADRRRS
jgi:hypothetical protein